MNAFRALYEQELPYVCNSLRRLGVPRDQISDLAQDVFMTAYQRFATYDPDRPLRPWLFGIAFRRWSAVRNRAHQAREVAGELPEVADPAHGPDDRVGVQQTQARVLEALTAVPLERRSVFILHDIEEQTMADIAGTLEIPVNTAYSRLRVARAEFTAAFRRLDLEVPR